MNRVRPVDVYVMVILLRNLTISFNVCEDIMTLYMYSQCTPTNNIGLYGILAMEFTQTLLLLAVFTFTAL